MPRHTRAGPSRSRLPGQHLPVERLPGGACRRSVSRGRRGLGGGAGRGRGRAHRATVWGSWVIATPARMVSAAAAGLWSAMNAGLTSNGFAFRCAFPGREIDAGGDETLQHPHVVGGPHRLGGAADDRPGRRPPWKSSLRYSERPPRSACRPPPSVFPLPKRATSRCADLDDVHEQAAAVGHVTARHVGAHHRPCSWAVGSIACTSAKPVMRCARARCRPPRRPSSRSSAGGRPRLFAGAAGASAAVSMPEPCTTRGWCGCRWP